MTKRLLVIETDVTWQDLMNAHSIYERHAWTSDEERKRVLTMFDAMVDAIAEQRARGGGNG